MIRDMRTTQPGHFGDGRDWFFAARYGLFVHWGLYAIPAWHEQYQWRHRIARAEYETLAAQWNPTGFDPEQWLDLMQEAGMEYICLTTKHHDGFCLWETQETDFNTVHTPYGRDIVGMLADACHRRQIPLCLYYSVADWHHPNYPNQGRHHELPTPLPGDKPDWLQYMEFLRAQVRELCSNYGEIHGFWWDMNVPEYRDPSINAMIRTLQPKAVINNRGFDDGDFGTPERDYLDDTAVAFDRATEACQSVGMESWGFRTDEDYYSDRHLISSIDRYLSRGANYLLNVGPTASGVIPRRSADILRRIGAWYHNVRESYSPGRPVPGYLANPHARLTRDGDTLYLHIYPTLPGDALKLKPLAVEPQAAVLLNDGRAIDWSFDMLPSDFAEQRPYLRLRNLPLTDFANTVMVVRLQFSPAGS